MFVVWGDAGLMAQEPTLVEVWKSWADDVEGFAIDCGHFVMEESPDDFTKSLLPFFLKV